MIVYYSVCSFQVLTRVTLLTRMATQTTAAPTIAALPMAPVTAMTFSFPNETALNSIISSSRSESEFAVSETVSDRLESIDVTDRYGKHDTHEGQSSESGQQSESAPRPFMTIEHIVQVDTAIGQQRARTSHGITHLIDLVIKHSITSRLSRALNVFHASLVEKVRTEPVKFAPAYQQSLEFVDSILLNNYPINRTPFASSLKPSQIQIIDSFLSLVKSSPQFVTNCFLGMALSDLNNVTRPPGEPFDDLSFLLRLRPLDILFHVLFPSDNDLKQRTEYFSTICAGLLVNQRAEKLTSTILDQFIQASSGSAYSSQLEEILLSLLQSGSFLIQLSAQTPQQHTQSQSSPSTPISDSPSPDFLNHRKRSLAKASSTSLSSSIDEVNDERVAQFLSRAVNLLLDFFSNQFIDSIPAKFLTFVHCTLSKIPQPHRKNCLLFITVKYFFYEHLYNLIVCPEHLGILTSYYVSDIQRKKILIPVFQKFYKTVIASVYYWNDDNSSENAILKRRIDQVMDRFAKFDPEAFDNSPELCKPGEMVVLTPSDVVTLYTTLFPSFTHPKPAPSYPISPRSNIVQLVRSVDSSAATLSLHSNNTSLPSLNESEPQFTDLDMYPSLKSPALTATGNGCDWNREDVQEDVEPIIIALIKKFPYLQFKDSSYLYSLRPGKFQHFKIPHPVTESWQIFKVDDDGIFTHVTGDDILVTEFQSLATSLKSANASLCSRRDSMSATVGNATDDNFAYLASPFPIGGRSYIHQIRSAVDKLAANLVNEVPFEPRDLYTQDSNYMSSLLTVGLEKSIAKGQYLEANEYSNAISALSRLTGSGKDSGKLAGEISNYIFSSLTKEKESSLAFIRSQSDICEAMTGPLTASLANVRKHCEAILTKLDHLRTKVWYMTEVRTSAMWIRAKDVACALANDSAGPPGFNPPTLASHPELKRNNSSSSIASTGGGFSFKRFTSTGSKREYAAKRQSIIGQFSSPNEGVFVSKELGGELKLSDKEADATNRWLSEQSIQNFCIGEERIHRFHCELDDLVKRIMGDALTSRRNKGHSTLTSSVLFRHDIWKRILEIEGKNRSSTPSYFAHSSSFHSDLEEESRRTPEYSDASRARSNTLDRFDKNATLRYHRMQKSSPNLLDMLSSMDINRRSSNDAREESLGHRRNRSLNDSDVQNSDNSDTYNASGDDGNSMDLNFKRQELDELILEYQMTLVSFIYTDIGVTWFEGMLYSWLSPSQEF